MKSPLLVIAGPTAVGKSALALEVARRCKGEIVNCDSMQMVRGLDIGTAKPTAAERRQVPHHLYDVIEPEQRYSAGRYMEQARAVCADIAGRDRLPIVVGGTGLYLRALLRGVFGAPGGDDRLRRRLQRLTRRLGDEGMHQLLARRDPAAAARIPPGDLRRILRALEVYVLARRPITSLHKEAQPIENMDVVKIGIRLERARLYDRINLRVERMFSGGLLAEVQALLAQGHDLDAKGFEALGYREAAAHLQGTIDFEEAVAQTQRQTRRYAKRQMTWFRKEPDLIWMEGPGEEPSLAPRVVQLLDTETAEGA